MEQKRMRKVKKVIGKVTEMINRIERQRVEVKVKEKRSALKANGGMENPVASQRVEAKVKEKKSALKANGVMKEEEEEEE
jgi:membrane protein implicated in regulation of membrane protease activity